MNAATLLLLLGSCVSSAATPAGYEPDREPRTVDELYLVYRYLGLPLPPLDATLIRWTEYRYYGKPLEQHDEPHLGLMVRKPVGFGPALVWDRGYENREFAPSRLRPIRPILWALIGLDWRADDWLTFAAQAYHLGWFKIAQEAFERGRVATRLGASSESSDNALLTLRTIAWLRGYYALLQPGTDRSLIYGRLKRIYDSDARFRDMDLYWQHPLPGDRVPSDLVAARAIGGGPIDQVSALTRTDPAAHSLRTGHD